MSNNNGLITAPINVQADLGTVLGTGSGDVGTNCTTGSIKKYSKKKPNSIQGYSSPSSALMIADHYALDAKAAQKAGTNDYSDIITKANAGWTYRGAQSPYYRVLDFDGYYHHAPCPFQQANGTSMVVDLIASYTDSALFYMLMRSGPLKNKAFSTASGIDTHNSRLSSDSLLDKCICVDAASGDVGLSFYDGGSYHSLIGAYLGIMLFTYNSQTGTYTHVTINNSDGIWAGSAVSAGGSQVDSDMYIVNLSSANIPAGDYKAVFCGKLVEGSLSEAHTYYLPVENLSDDGYPAIVDLTVGGYTLYTHTILGLEAYAAGVSPTSYTNQNFYSTARNYWVYVRFDNNPGSGVPVNIPTGTTNSGKFYLKATINVFLPDNGTSTPDYTVTRKTFSITTQTGAAINIATGESGVIIFRIDNIWNVIETDTASNVDTGTRAVITTRLYYGDPDATNPTPYAFYQGLPAPITVTYGTGQ